MVLRYPQLTPAVAIARTIRHQGLLLAVRSRAESVPCPILLRHAAVGYGDHILAVKRVPFVVVATAPRGARAQAGYLLRQAFPTSSIAQPFAQEFKGWLFAIWAGFKAAILPMLLRMFKNVEVTPHELVGFCVSEAFCGDCFNHFNLVNAPTQV